jgi:ABC-type transport system involved in cytochrome c biogenesis permease subunit
MIGLFHTAALLCYVASAALLAAAFAGRSVAARAALPVAAAGAVLHACALVSFTRTFGELPLVGLAPSLSSIAFVIVAFVLLSAVLSNARPLAMIVLPVVSLLVAGSLLLGLQPTGQPMAFRGTWFALHVIFAFAAYAGLTVSAAAGVLYLLQFRELKGKHLGRIFRFFPPLPTLDRIGKAGLLVAFPALTIALLVGWGWSLRFGNAVNAENAQVIWGVLTWMVFGLIVVLRAPRTPGRERRGALASVVGFVVVVLAYVVLRFSPAARGGFL